MIQVHKKNWDYYTSLTSHWLKLNHMTWNNFNVLWKLTQTRNNIIWYMFWSFCIAWWRASSFIIVFAHGEVRVAQSLVSFVSVVCLFIFVLLLVIVLSVLLRSTATYFPFDIFNPFLKYFRIFSFLCSVL